MSQSFDYNISQEILFSFNSSIPHSFHLDRRNRRSDSSWQKGVIKKEENDREENDRVTKSNRKEGGGEMEKNEKQVKEQGATENWVVEMRITRKKKKSQSSERNEFDRLKYSCDSLFLQNYQFKMCLKYVLKNVDLRVHARMYDIESI